MMGYSQSRSIILVVLLSVLMAICFAAPPAFPSRDVQVQRDYPLYDEAALEFTDDAVEPHEEKRAVLRMGKRAMMRFGKRAVMRFGKRSVVRLG